MGKQSVFWTQVCSSAHILVRDVQSKILQRIYNRTTPEEQRWIVRIILKGDSQNSLNSYINTLLPSPKDMVISVKETTVFSVFHPDAQDLYNTCSDLKKVAWELWDPSFRLNAAVSALALETPQLLSERK